MTRVYDPQYPRPLVTPQADDDIRAAWKRGELSVRHDPYAELSAGEWREATRED